MDYPLEIDDYFRYQEDLFRISGFVSPSASRVHCVRVDVLDSVETETDDRRTFLRSVVAPLVADYMAE